MVSSIAVVYLSLTGFFLLAVFVSDRHPFFFFSFFSLKSIEKAIVASDLDMTPNNDGEVIRLSLPQLTSDRRKVFSHL